MVKVDIRGLEGVAAMLDSFPETGREAMKIALNDTLSGKGLGVYRDDLLSQVDFGKGYLDDDRLGLTQRATTSRLEAVVTGRQRPTSLARFARSQALNSRNGVTVRVKPGSARVMKKAFLTRLRAGSQLDDSAFNVGLAIRLSPDEVLRNKREIGSTPRLAPNVYLLYGPSVDQVLRSSAETKTPEVLDLIELEFTRQFSRLIGAK